MSDAFIRAAPDQYLRDHIAIARAQIPWYLQRRLTDPSSAPYMRDCVRWAIRQIREYSAELARR